MWHLFKKHQMEVIKTSGVSSRAPSGSAAETAAEDTDSTDESSADEEDGPNLGDHTQEESTAVPRGRFRSATLQHPTKPVRLVKTVVTRWWSLHRAMVRML